MSNILIKPKNLPEVLVWYYIIGTYLIYFLGAQYILSPLLGLFLSCYFVFKWWNQTEQVSEDEKLTLSASAWIWIIAVLVIEFAMIVSHANFNLGLKQFIESSASWSRGWALFGLFPLAGHLKIRPELIYRAVCILCAQSIVMIILGNLASIVGIPDFFYISPFGSLPLNGGTLQYEVVIFQSAIDSRVRLFAPWSPALGITSNIYFFLALQETNKKWRILGIVGAIAMTISSISRTAILCLPFVIICGWFITNFLQPKVQFTAAGFSFFVGLFSTQLINWLKDFKDYIYKFRQASSKTRGALERIAFERWWNEAPIWGHGISERGPMLVAGMPIGTHHTWLGLLFIQGLVGCIALIVALLWSFIDLIIKAQTNDVAKLGLKIILILIVFSFSEHIDGSAYIYWPGLLILGIAFKDDFSLTRAGISKY